MSHPGGPRLALEVAGGDLILALRNESAEPVRVWEFWNSWGWTTISLLVAARSGAGPEARLVKRWDAEFTEDGPTFLEVPAEGERRLRLDPTSTDWESDEPLEPLRAAVLTVRAALEIPPSPEATEKGVVVGRVVSEPAGSEPPHAWLFGDPGAPAP